ncbi:hypothetical protein R1V99_02010, partial [Stenotrophomonas maltophilia]|nr:hypothetical protein [Stenotrophomonas maltophilia]
MVARRGTPVHQWLGNRRQTVEPWSWTPCISLETAEKLSSELRIGNGSTLGGRKNRAAHPVVFKGVASLLLIFLVEGSNPSRPTNAINDPSHSERHRSAVPFVLLPAKCLFRLGAARPRRLAFGGCLRA